MATRKVILSRFTPRILQCFAACPARSLFSAVESFSGINGYIPLRGNNSFGQLRVARVHLHKGT